MFPALNQNDVNLTLGLATRHSVVFRHEEAPPWVLFAWTVLSFFSYGILSTVAFKTVILVGKLKFYYNFGIFGQLFRVLMFLKTA